MNSLDPLYRMLFSTLPSVVFEPSHKLGCASSFHAVKSDFKHDNLFGRKFKLSHNKVKRKYFVEKLECVKMFTVSKFDCESQREREIYFQLLLTCLLVRFSDLSKIYLSFLLNQEKTDVELNSVPVNSRRLCVQLKEIWKFTKFESSKSLILDIFKQTKLISKPQF